LGSRGGPDFLWKRRLYSSAVNRTKHRSG
jgi:hypothetical protein